MNIEILTPENLRWFWTEYRNKSRDRLTTEGAKTLYNTMCYPQYDFPLQPLKIKRQILKMLRTNDHGWQLAQILDGKQCANLPIEFEFLSQQERLEC